MKNMRVNLKFQKVEVNQCTSIKRYDSQPNLETIEYFGGRDARMV